jgi:hypothetical protein
MLGAGRKFAIALVAIILALVGTGILLFVHPDLDAGAVELWKRCLATVEIVAGVFIGGNVLTHGTAALRDRGKGGE